MSKRKVFFVMRRASRGVSAEELVRRPYCTVSEDVLVWKPCCAESESAARVEAERYQGDKAAVALGVMYDDGGLDIIATKIKGREWTLVREAK